MAFRKSSSNKWDINIPVNPILHILSLQVPGPRTNMEGQHMDDSEILDWIEKNNPIISKDEHVGYWRVVINAKIYGVDKTLRLACERCKRNQPA